VDRGRGIVVALNKVDLLSRSAQRAAEQRARDKLSFASWVPIERLSALSGRGTGRLLDTVSRVGRSFSQRVTTGELNRFMEEVISTHPPPVRGGRAPRVYYVTQADTAPPLFVVQTSHPDQLHFSYQRYIVNALRKRFGFEGVPLRIRYRRPQRRSRR
jgi:GTP-binding protein